MKKNNLEDIPHKQVLNGIAIGLSAALIVTMIELIIILINE